MPKGIAKSGKRKSPLVPRRRVCIKCIVCGGVKEMSAGAFAQRIGLFCSQQCYGLSKVISIPKKERKSKSKLELICAQCGKITYKWKSQIHGKTYCDRKCHTIAKKTGFDMKKWYEENKERNLKKKKEWVENNREKSRKIKTKWRNKNKEKVYAIYLKRMAAKKKKSAANAEQIKQLLSAAGNKCVYCGLETSKIYIDHVHAISKGGNHKISNLLPSCFSCNSSKATKEVADWLYDKHGVEGLARTVYFMENKKHIGF